jgi:hypothetical protein
VECDVLDRFLDGLHVGESRALVVGTPGHLYRAWDATLAQNEQRQTRRLMMPVLRSAERQAGGNTLETR